jgi:outer membrane protein
MIWKVKNIVPVFLTVTWISIQTADSQSLPTDSLSLENIISEVIQNHPVVKKAMEDLNTSDAKIGMAQSARLPYVDASSSYSRIGPISTITFAEFGTFTLYSHDNYSAAVEVSQTLADFGKTGKAIQLEKQGKELSLQSIEQVKQQLSQTAISNYYALVYLQEAIKIKDEELNALNEHLNFIRRKEATGSAIQYEILTTQVRISTTENQKTDLETALKIQRCRLNSLLGKPESTPQLVKQTIRTVTPGLKLEALIETAMQNRDEMKIAREKAKLDNMRLNYANAQNNPVLNAFATGGIKNGYIPNLNDPKANFTAGFGFKVPIFDGRRNKYNIQQAKTAIQANDDDTEISRRNIVNEVIESESNVSASFKKIQQGELQLKQALRAYDLAKVRFESGVITNLELLDNSTAVSESRLMLLKSKIDYTVNLYNLKAATGERLY